jgi:16S rRNA U516 pseudouridylate synthase RsuA-like enzyme
MDSPQSNNEQSSNDNDYGTGRRRLPSAHRDGFRPFGRTQSDRDGYAVPGNSTSAPSRNTTHNTTNNSFREGVNSYKRGGGNHRGGDRQHSGAQQRGQSSIRPRFDPNKRKRLDRHAHDSRVVLQMERPYPTRSKVLPSSTLIKALISYQLASRALCLQIIREQRVEINQRMALHQNERVFVDHDELAIDGVPLQRKNFRPVYIVLNKPKNVSGSREKGFKTLYTYLVNKRGWYIPSGALRKSHSGLVLVTNDPEHKIPSTSPLRYLLQEYAIKVHRPVKKSELRDIQTKIQEQTNEQFVHSVTVEERMKGARATWITVQFQGSNIDAVLRVLKAANIEVVSTSRTKLGPLDISKLGVGAWYQLPQDLAYALSTQAREPYETEKPQNDSFWKSLSHRFLGKL